MDSRICRERISQPIESVIGSSLHAEALKNCHAQMANFITETAGLIKRLYDPAHSGEAEQIQSKLQEVQRSPAGWQLANELIRNNDQNVRFFAALTFTVKLNQDGASLTEDDALILLTKLLDWLMQSIWQNEGLLVTRKICSTLVTFFMVPKSPWFKCIRHLMCCCMAGHAIPENSTYNFPTNTEVAAALYPEQLSAVLTFAQILAEETTKIDNESQHFHYCHARVNACIRDACAIMRRSWDLLNAQPNKYEFEVLHCYQSWVEYVRGETFVPPDQLRHLQELVEMALQSLLIEESFEDAAEFFIDTLTSYETFLGKNYLDALSDLLLSAWGNGHILKFQVDSADEDSLLFGQLALAFGQAVSETLVKNLNRSKQIMDLMHCLTRAQNYDTIDQNMSNAVVEFWDTFNSAALDRDSPTFEFCKQHWFEAIEALCIATRMPLHNGEFKNLNADHPFAEFRNGVVNVVHMTYGIYNVAILDTLISSALIAHSNFLETAISHTDSANLALVQGWPKLEAVFNCLRGLSDIMQYDNADKGTEDENLKRLFGSSMYSHLTSFDNPVPKKLRREALDLIGEHDGFFGRHPQYLLSTLDLLFRCLEHTSLLVESACAIYKLCSPNRKILFPKLEQFLDVTEKFFSSSTTRETALSNLTGAAASIIQALPSEDQKIQPLNRLLGIIEQDFHSQTTTRVIPGEPVGEEAALATLELLNSVGSAFQSPHDAPIDLEEEISFPLFWTRGPGSATQARIIQLLLIVVTPNRESGGVIRAACEVVRAGYREFSPGPFVFEPKITVDLVTSVPIHHTGLLHALSTAGAYVLSRSTQAAGGEEAVHSLLTFICQVIHDLHHPRNDPDVAHACLIFINRLLSKFPTHLLTLPLDPMSMIFSFSICCLDGADPMPKKAAAGMWTTLMAITHLVSDAQAHLDQLCQSIGPLLAPSVINQIGGNAARSELDFLAEPLMKMIFREPMAKKWIEAALFSVAFPSSRASETDKRKFLAQLSSLRGGKQTKVVVKEFWLLCRGTPMGYG